MTAVSSSSGTSNLIAIRSDTLNFTGSDQTYSIPSNATYLNRVMGAGGGGGGRSFWLWRCRRLFGKFNWTSYGSSSLTVVVGEGNHGENTSDSYGGSGGLGRQCI